DFQFTAFGVEGDNIFRHDGRGGSIVFRLVLPGQAAGIGVEGVKVVAAEAAAHEDAAYGDGRGRQRAVAGNRDFPGPGGAVLARPLCWRFDARHFAAKVRVDVHGDSSGCEMPNQPATRVAGAYSPRNGRWAICYTFTLGISPK